MPRQTVGVFLVAVAVTGLVARLSAQSGPDVLGSLLTEVRGLRQASLEELERALTRR